MGKNPRPKKQHYVPRFYLEHFTDGDGMVWTYDSQCNGVRPATPLNTAVETNFYSIMDDEGSHNDEIEHWLQGVEGKASELYPKVLRGERLEGQEKADFSVFVSSLYARSPAMITAYAEFTGYMAQHLNDFVLASRARFDAMMDRYDADKGIETTQKQRDETFAFARDKSRYIIQVDKKRGLRALGVTDRLTEIFYDMTWVVFESPHQHLVTSDNPVIQVNPPDDHHPIYGDGGFLNKRANVSVPLSSSRMLGLAWMADAPKGVHRVPKEQGRCLIGSVHTFRSDICMRHNAMLAFRHWGRSIRSPGCGWRSQGCGHWHR